ncbi:MAG: cell division protein FtsA [Elusimicrobia bacterium]|nr:cell division protein FtsA [Elusimicrobiota bacterium]
MKDKYFCGLDVGTSKVCAVIAAFDPVDRQLNILGLGEAVCKGLRKGVVVNIDDTRQAVVEAIEKAEAIAEVKVKDVIINVNGYHIEGHLQQGDTRIPRSDREITEEDVERVINSARAVPLSSDRQIIHSIPLDFRVDNQSGVVNPVGMEGNHLEVEVLLVTGDSSLINNLDKCIARAGFGIQSKIATILAPAEAVLAPEEKALGCAIIDIGEETVNLAIFIEGQIKYIGHNPIGSNYITTDLAYGLRTSFAEAKRIKEDYGQADKKSALDGEIEYLGVDGQTKYSANSEKIYKIIKPRVNEIVDFIVGEIVKSGYKQLIPGGIILSGGGSQLKGICRTIEERAEGIQVRVGRPRDLKGESDLVSEPKYATAVGMIEYLLRTNASYSFQDLAAVGRGGFFEKLKKWIDEMF